MEPKEVLKKLVEGKLPDELVRELQTSPKDESRFEQVREIEQERVPWKDTILIPIQEHLYIVEKDGKHIVKCSCGHEFCDSKLNWKEFALAYEADPKEIWGVEHRGARKGWQTIREFYCPGCGTMLEVEVVPPGYPFIHNFIPDEPYLMQDRKRILKRSRSG